MPTVSDKLATSKAKEATLTKSVWLSFWHPILLAAGVASLVASVALFSVSISRPFVGASIRYQEEGIWVVGETDYGGLAREAGIAAGDVVLAVNGQSVEELTQAHGRLTPGGIRELTVIDDAGVERAVSVAGAAPSGEGLHTPIGLLILGVAFWGTGMIVYIKRPRHKAVLPLYLLGLTIPVGLMAVTATSRWSTDTLLLEYVMYVLISGLLVHFFLQFPREKRLVTRHPRILYLCYVPAIVPLCLFFLFGQSWHHFESYVRAPFLGYLSLAALVAAVSLGHSYVKPHSQQERQQIKVLFAGIFLSIVSFVGLSVVPAALTGEPLAAPGLSIMSAIAIPIALMYVILRHQLMDIDFYVSRALVYGVIVALMASGYGLIALGLSLASRTLEQAALIATLVVFSTLVAIWFQPARSKVEHLVYRLLFKERLVYRQSLTFLADTLPSFKDVDSLSHFVVDETRKTMQLSGSCLLLLDVSKSLVIKAVAGELCDPNIQTEIVNEARRLWEKEGPIVAAPEGFGTAFLVRLSVRDSALGALLLGPKASGASFTPEELHFLRSFASQAALAMENAQLLEKTRELSVSDELTGLYNRRYFYEVLKTEMSRTRRYGRSFSVVMLDLDGFKEYNDRFGHTNGDSVLKSLARTLRSSLRRADTAFRYGGDEFTIILPATDAERAKRIADRIRSKWLLAAKAEHLVLESPLGLSAGIAEFPENAETADGLVFLADTALHRSKMEGGCKTTLVSGLGALETDVLDRATLDQVYALAATVDAKDPFTYGHSERVAIVSEMLGKAIGLSRDKLATLQAASLLHDIGKVGVSDSILTKPGKLTEDEWAVIWKHPAEGSRIVGYVKGLAPLVPMIRHHHEWYDGAGYPDGLKGEDIPIGARIISIADAYDTMTTPRTYRNVISHEEAVDELRRCSGTQFDPELVDAFCQATTEATKQSETH
jgi:diguanylate cyclase (GGDEF)-like protein